MVEFTSHPKAIARASLYTYLADRVGPVSATKWLFSGCASLGGLSPLAAIKADMDDDVDMAAAAFVVASGVA